MSKITKKATEAKLTANVINVKINEDWKQRPLRIIAKGTFGVVVGGEVFPITVTGHNVAVVDLTKPAKSKDDCRVAKLADLGIAKKASSEAAPEAEAPKTATEVSFAKLSKADLLNLVAKLGEEIAKR